MLVFVQPFGFGSPGGGPRIYRSLADGSPLPILSICTAPSAPPATTAVMEKHLPVRPFLGRIESTRFAPSLYALERGMSGAFQNRLSRTCKEAVATAIHGLAHSLDFWPAYQVAKQLRIPYFLSVHDDLDYALHGRPERRFGLSKLQEVWTGADGRFVISEELGDEYRRLFGEAPYTVVTDGLASVACGPAKRDMERLDIYFMGLFHLSYTSNLNALLAATSALRRKRPDLPITLRFRCESLPPEVKSSELGIEVLPFGSQSDVESDLESANLLYLPLPFGPDYERFVKFSLSTKMVTYVGSGLPILYQGPPNSAACNSLRAHDAAIIADSTEPAVIACALASAPVRGREVAANAIKLAESRFLLTRQKSAFWDQVLKCATA